ncbi:MAG: MBL fold metallo-hydrolase [Promethearchaeota archaeon]
MHSIDYFLNEKNEKNQKNTQIQEIFKDHKLIFLGTGGGRFQCVTQHRHTGGIIYKFNGLQMHIDPGPGAIVYLNQLKINRFDTKYILITHPHTDHCNDCPVIIESVHHDLRNKKGTLIAPKTYLNELAGYYKNLLENIIEMRENKEVILEDIKNKYKTKIKGTKMVHGNTDGFGFIMEQTKFKTIKKKMDDNRANLETFSYRIAFTSDTEIYNGFLEVYRDVDILVANVLRPDNLYCRRHTSVDEIIPIIEKLQPKALIMTHFGFMMDSKKFGNNVPKQVAKIKRELDQYFKGENCVKVIGAQDNQIISIGKLLG